MNRNDSSSDSDEEDHTQLQKFIEAADTTLLSNAMFKHDFVGQKKMDIAHKEPDPEKEPSKSQRYLPESETEEGGLFNITEAMRHHVYKKLSERINQRIEFYDIHSFSKETPKHKKNKSKLQLLLGLDCYAKPYEEFEFETKGPTKKPCIQRRKIDLLESDESEEKRLKTSAVDAQDIISGKLMYGWVKKPIKPHKVFHYKQVKANLFHSLEPKRESRKKKNQ